MPFALKVSFENIFIKMFILVGAAAYRLEVYNLVRKGMIKISLKHFFRNFKKSSFVKSMQEILSEGAEKSSFWNIFQRESVLMSASSRTALSTL